MFFFERAISIELLDTYFISECFSSFTRFEPRESVSDSHCQSISMLAFSVIVFFA